MAKKRSNEFSENNLVVQSNDLIQNANWRLNTMSLKLYKMVISCIDTENPPKDNKIRLSKNEIIKFLEAENVLQGTKTDQRYSTVRKALKNIRDKSVDLDMGKGVLTVGLMDSVYWEKDTDIVTCRIGPEMMPFLIDLNRNFLQYPVLNVQCFSSKYGIILYELLMSEWKKTQFKHFTFEVDDLRYSTNTVNKYSKWVNFEARVLKPAVDDINQAEVEFFVKYRKRKGGGKSIRFIDFTIYIKERCNETWQELIERGGGDNYHNMTIDEFL